MITREKFRNTDSEKKFRYTTPLLLVFLFFLLLFTTELKAQQEDTLSPQALKRLSLEELMEMEVTSVSRRAEKLTNAASAIQVITGEDIRRSGATSLPEALNLATNLQVAKLNSYATILSARGFNALFSNKLLVMIDGRTVYSPLFAGVFWDAQSVVLEDIERIEVISGPGGTLWEANAVNGVINIITKSSKDTQGVYATLAGGTYLRKHGEVRYGGKIGDNLSYRVYAQHMDRDHTFHSSDSAEADDWRLSQSGFRLDWSPSEMDELMVQGNFYLGKEHTLPRETTLDGQNIVGRWTRGLSPSSELVVQAYFDRTWRRMPTISFDLATYDVDMQYRWGFGQRHRMLVGAGYRLMKDHTRNYTTSAGILPNSRDMHLFNAFVQDEITIVPENLYFTIGTKLLHNIYTDFELQPSARITWMPGQGHTVWSAVSRAVRTPSRIDRDYYIPTTPLPPDQPQVAGGPDFVSEKVIAYELGYRMQPRQNISLSLASFYNQYDDLYTVEALPGTQIYQIQNGGEGNSWGIEFTSTYRLLRGWRLRAGYTHFNKDLKSKPGRSFDPSSIYFDAENQFQIQSNVDLPWNLEWDLVAWYRDRLPGRVPDYFTFDMRLAWVHKNWEISVAGQNLWEDRHREWGTAIPRGVYGRLIWRFLNE